LQVRSGQPLLQTSIHNLDNNITYKKVRQSFYYIFLLVHHKNICTLLAQMQI